VIPAWNWGRFQLESGWWISWLQGGAWKERAQTGYHKSTIPIPLSPYHS